MNYLNAIKILNDIESEYDVMSVKYKDVPVWPYVRIYLQDTLTFHQARKGSISNIYLVLKNLFFYNPLVLLKKEDIWHYCSVITRKQIGNMYYHHVTGDIALLYNRVLCLDSPERGKSHLPRKQIPEKNIISNAWSIFLTRSIEYLLRIKELNIEKIDLLESIIQRLNIQLDIRFYVRLLYAQKLATDILLKLGNKPKVVVMECPYTQMGSVWSMHAHNIPIIEFQHGVLNKEHYAYNSNYYSGILAPDEICVYGDEEFKYLTNKKNKYCTKVSRTGLFILEKSDEFFTEDIFSDYRDLYKHIIVISGETPYEKQLFQFIDCIAKQQKSDLFIYIPRRNSVNLETVTPNVSVKYNVNIYQYLKWCDIHCTVTSTTCLEAHYFHKPNIFYMIDNTGLLYYGAILNEANGAFFIKNEDEFIEAIKKCNGHFEYKEFFSHNHKDRIKNVLDYYLYKSE